MPKGDVMDREQMSNEENYCFDVAGYLIVRDVLTREDVKACNRDLDQKGTTPLPESLAKLRDHPVLVWYLNQICGEEFQLDQEHRLIGEAGGERRRSAGRRQRATGPSSWLLSAERCPVLSRSTCSLGVSGRKRR